MENPAEEEEQVEVVSTSCRCNPRKKATQQDEEKINSIIIKKHFEKVSELSNWNWYD